MKRRSRRPSTPSSRRSPRGTPRRSPACSPSKARRSTSAARRSEGATGSKPTTLRGSRPARAKKLEVDIETVHFLAPEVARQDGRTRLLAADGGAPSTAKYSATFLKTQGKWRIASIRELDDPTITHRERLRELEWLIGDWIEETGDAVIETSIAWADDDNFLLRSFAVKVRGKADLKGTQRIGWDPTTKQIRSWVFDSRGAYGEGHWSRNGERWIIKSTGVRPDAMTTSATQVLTRLGKDRMLWSSTSRTLGGETRDDIDEFTMVRRPPPPK